MARRVVLRVMIQLAVATGLWAARHPTDAPVSLSHDVKMVTTEAGTPALIVYLRTHELVEHAEYALLGNVAPVSGNGSVHELPLSTFSKSDVADGRLLLELAHSVNPEMYSVTISLFDGMPGLSVDDALLARRQSIAPCCPEIAQFGSIPQPRRGAKKPQDACGKDDTIFVQHHPQGVMARHPEKNAVTFSFDAKLITNEIDSALIIFLREDELSDDAEYAISADLVPLSGAEIIYRLHMPGKKISKRQVRMGSGQVRMGIGRKILAPGTYTVTLKIWDAFPGLDEDDALLAMRRQMVRCCPRNDRVIINLGLPKTGVYASPVRDTAPLQRAWACHSQGKGASAISSGIPGRDMLLEIRYAGAGVAVGSRAGLGLGCESRCS